MAAPQRITNVSDEAPIEHYSYSTRSERVARGRISPIFILTSDPRDCVAQARIVDIGCSNDESVAVTLHTCNKITERELETVDKASLEAPSLFALDIHLPPVFSDSEFTLQQLALVSAMVRACDFVVLRSASQATIDPFFWKTDGGIPPAKLLLPFTAPRCISDVRNHSLAGFYSTSSSHSARIRREFPPYLFSVDRAVLEERTNRQRQKLAGFEAVAEGSSGDESPRSAGRVPSGPPHLAGWRSPVRRVSVDGELHRVPDGKGRSGIRRRPRVSQTSRSELCMGGVCSEAPVLAGKGRRRVRKQAAGVGGVAVSLKSARTSRGLHP